MFRIKPLSAHDYLFAVELANTMNWNMTVEDFKFIASLEPEGLFLAMDGDKRVGIATCISYGRVGWFGNLVVEPNYRSKGAATQLVKHAIHYLQGRGVKTIGLYTYQNLTKFYGKVGFKEDVGFAVLRAENLRHKESLPFMRIRNKDLSLIEAFDREFFGGDRRRLLESIILEEGNVGFYHSENNAVTGYVAATVYDQLAWLGPLICHPDKLDTALGLVAAALSELAGKTVYTVVAKKETPLVDMFLSVGFKEDFSVTRMFLGEPAGKNCIYLAESLERG
ncbi:MAG: GNAT family N-acetyltransferase [Candidatus Bathyarchaeota archaeon]|nr:GNAT family N-acetyltransferase [Candidatus Bathyarchaeota archaeon]